MASTPKRCAAAVTSRARAAAATVRIGVYSECTEFDPPVSWFHSELRTRVVEHDVDDLEPGVELLGRDDAHGGRDPLADLGPGHVDDDPVVRGDLDLEEIRGRQRGQRRARRSGRRRSRPRVPPPARSARGSNVSSTAFTTTVSTGAATRYARKRRRLMPGTTVARARSAGPSCPSPACSGPADTEVRSDGMCFPPEPGRDETRQQAIPRNGGRRNLRRDRDRGFRPRLPARSSRRPRA